MGNGPPQGLYQYRILQAGDKRGQSSMQRAGLGPTIPVTDLFLECVEPLGILFKG